MYLLYTHIVMLNINNELVTLLDKFVILYAPSLSFFPFANLPRKQHPTFLAM
jgi:hypothetical protein